MKNKNSAKFQNLAPFRNKIAKNYYGPSITHKDEHCKKLH